MSLNIYIKAGSIQTLTIINFGQLEYTYVSYRYTEQNKSLLRVLEKYNNDYLYRQSSGRDWGGVTYLYVGEVFVMPLGPIISMAVINKEKCVSVLQPPLHKQNSGRRYDILFRDLLLNSFKRISGVFLLLLYKFLF